MGAGASTSGNSDESSKQVSTITKASNSAKKVAPIVQSSTGNFGAASMVIEDSEPGTIPLFGMDMSTDDKQTGTLSNNKLKKIALGIQGYKDQQRDYDETLATIDVHKTAQVQWSEPKADDSKSPSKKYMQPPSPSKPDQSIFNSPPHHNPNRTPLHTPLHSAYGSFGIKSSEKVPLNQPMSSSSSQYDLAVNGSFSRGNHSMDAHQSPMPTQQPRIGISGNGIAPQNATAPSFMTPPTGIPVRPMGRAMILDDNSMYATFGGNDMQDISLKPQNVPNLNLMSNGLMSSANTPVRGNGGAPSFNMAASMHGTPSGMGSTGGPVPLMGTPLSVPGTPYVPPGSAGANTRPFTGNQTMPMPMQMQMQMQLQMQMNKPGTAPFPMGSPPPRGMAPPPRGVAGNAPRGSNPMQLTGNGPISAVPVVKETTVVKRNKVDLPTNLNHAKPTAGDWLNKRYFVNNYILLDTLGVGSYGEVRLCKDRNTEKLYAIKIISKDFLKKKKQGKSDETYFEDIKREIAIMKKLLHPNILRLFEVLDDPKVNKMYLVLEYMKRGDLINVLKKRGGVDANSAVTAETQFTPLSDFEVWNITKQLVAGIRYLHHQNVIHGDIKPQNLLLGEDGIVKIADFGISKMLSASSQQLQDAGGTPAFMSPELIQNESSFSGQLADVWAMGATIFMLRFGRPPWVAKSIINLYHKICNEALSFPSPLDPGLQNLLEGMLEKDPQHRFTISQVIAHPWYMFPPANHVLKPSTASGTNSNPSSVHISGNANSNNKSATPSAKQPLQSSGVGSTINSGATAANTPSNALNFQPPASYESEEAEAMKKPLAEIDQHEVFMSIGAGVGGATRVRKSSMETSDDPFASTVEDFDLDDEDDEDEEKMEKIEETNSSRSAGGNSQLQTAAGDDSDVMKTNWGADVFGIVEDEFDDDDDDVDDDCDDDGDELEFGQGTKKKLKSSKNVKANAHGGLTADESNSAKQVESHNEMSEAEEARRSRMFMKKAGTRKSTHQMQINTPSSTGSEATSPSKNPSSSYVMMPSANASFQHQQSTSSLCDESEKILSVQLNNSLSSPIANRRPSHRQEHALDDDPQAISAEDFHNMLDTLSQQKSREAVNAAHEDALMMMTVKSANVAWGDVSLQCSLRNDRSGVGFAFYSDIGVRSTQEDRCVLIPNVSSMKALESYGIKAGTKEQLSWYSIACIFDGHSGDRTSQHLSHFLPQMLVTHEKFLDSKQADIALLDTFSMIDFQVCQILSEEDDSSGSTGLVVVYDGKRQKLTVAGLGDSLCVLSRSGKAIEMNPLHRLDNEKERARVVKSGGKIISNRVNGVLAVSRAFGDILFKSPSIPPPDESSSSNRQQKSSTSGSILDHPPLVIAEPDLHCEMITPMTEFIILASDGLWDFMSPQSAVTFVRAKLMQHHDLQLVAKELVKEALQRGSIDNVTAAIVTFNVSLTDKPNSKA